MKKHYDYYCDQLADAMDWYRENVLTPPYPYIGARNEPNAREKGRVLTLLENAYYMLADAQKIAYKIGL